MKRILITGGAGFIGSNAAKQFSDDGWDVTVLDDLSRQGAAENLKWLERSAAINFVRADIRDANLMKTVVKDCVPDVVLHLAAQVAVTTSVIDPRLDFEINALGTFNVLEAIRIGGIRPFLIYSSTNKVYGEMEDSKIVSRATRYEYDNFPDGVSEGQPLDFHSPYGCSKGSADQYVRTYTKTFDIPSVILRQSCIYGQRQFGVEDQGWVAWFTIATILGRKITIFGDGKQVRDVLHVEDLVSSFRACIAHQKSIAGEIFNIGGGPNNVLSVLELTSHLHEVSKSKPNIGFDDWRPGDQKVYISDIRKAADQLGWAPQIQPKEGVRRFYAWVQENRTEIRSALDD